MKLRSRLIAGFSAVLLLALAGLGMAALSVREVALTTDRMMEQDFGGVDVSSRLRVLMSALMMESARRIGQPGRPLARLAEAGRGEGASLVAEARGMARGPEEHAIIDRAEQGLAALLVALENADGGPPGAGIPEPVVLAFEELRAATLDLYAFNMREMRERGERVQDGARSLMLALALLAAFMVILGVLASLRLARRLAAPMERLAVAATELSRGRFDVSVPATGLHEGDVLAERFNEMAHAIGRFHAMNLDRIVAEQQRLDRVLANIDDGLVIFDEGGRIERLNPVAAERLALDPEEALGRRLSQVADLPQLARRVDAVLTRPAAADAGSGQDLRLGKGEAARTLACALTPFSDGSKAGVVMVVRDVTEERLFERLRSEFVLRASHELRTPVTSVRMALGLLARSMDPPEGSRERELLDTVASDMNRLLQLIENLLDLSRLYARTRALERSDVAAGALLRGALDRFAEQARQRQVRLCLDLGDALPRLSVDRGLLDRVLDNLLGNALRNTPQGGEVRLSCRTTAGHLAIEVSDSGQGIPDARPARVFEPFVQVGGKTGGAGLGLAMCREIVEQHDGRIDVASVPGQGTRFTVVLPVREAATDS